MAAPANCAKRERGTYGLPSHCRFNELVETTYGALSSALAPWHSNSDSPVDLAIRRIALARAHRPSRADNAIIEAISLMTDVWQILKETVLGFINDDALSRGAAIAFYTVTSVAPVLLIVIAIAGLAFGEEAAQNAITAQLSDLIGDQTAELLQTAVVSTTTVSGGKIRECSCFLCQEN
jgi:hypothetical protein